MVARRTESCGDDHHVPLRPDVHVLPCARAHLPRPGQRYVPVRVLPRLYLWALPTMSPDTSTLSEAKAALLAMSAEAVELKNAVGGSITDAVADWLAPQYALAARERLATATGAE